MGFSETVIIFHPGSRHLYLGRATDPSPLKLLHVIARRRSNQAPEHAPYQDQLFPKSLSTLSSERKSLPPEVYSAKKQLSLLLRSSRAPSPNHLLASNAVKQDGGDTGGDSGKVVKTEDNPGEHVVGEAVLSLKTIKDWSIHCPWRRGALNLHRETGGSITAVVQDLETIWTWAIKNLLNISLEDLPNYQAVLVIPVMFDRGHAGHLTNLLLNGLGFSKCFLVQDHVAASFGAGLSCCTVVDVGDQKISISCVEDAVSYPQSRLTLRYGGGDLTYALAVLLSEKLASTKEFQELEIMAQWEFSTWLKETRCHLVKAEKSEEKEAVVKWRESLLRFNLGEELNILPLAYFNPDLLRCSVPKKAAVIFYANQPTLPEDPHDSNFLAELKPAKRLKENGEDSGAGGGAGVEQEDPGLMGDATKISETFSSEPLAIDRAILTSVEKCNVSDDLKRRLFSRVLITGGGFNFSGLSQWLARRLQAHNPKFNHPLGQQDTQEVTPQVITSPNFTPSTLKAESSPNNPCTITWKGAAILSSLDTAKDLWITQKEWHLNGVKRLREHSLFYY